MSKQRTALVWRILAGLACLLLAVASVQSVGGMIWRSQSPRTALRFDPANPYALTAGLDRRFALNRKSLDAATMQLIARAALRSQVLLPRAMRQLGYALEDGTARPAAAPFILLSDRMTRRDRAAQFWLVQYYLKQRRYDPAVEHFDVLFRLDKRVQDLVFPLLGQSLGDARLRAAIARRADAGAPWMTTFLDFTNNTSKHDREMYALLTTLQSPQQVDGINRIVEQSITQLAARGDGALASSLFDRAVARKVLDASDSFFGKRQSVTRATGLPWQLYSQADTAAGWRGVGGGRRLEIFAESGTRGPVARQVRFDPPGPMKIEGVFGESAFPAGAAVDLGLSCGSGGATAWHHAFTGSRPHDVRVVIPPQCRTQVYTITGIGSSGDEPLEARLRDLRFSPAMAN